MRHLCPTVSTLAALVFLSGSFVEMKGQAADGGLSVDNYTLVSQQRATRTLWYLTYQAELVNPGSQMSNVTALVTSPDASATVVPGQGVVHFASPPPGSTVMSTDTFTLLVDRAAPFSITDLQWQFNGPVANAGPPQFVPVGKKAFLDGSQSSDSGGLPLAYSWSITSAPPGSAAALSNSSAPYPTFVPDVAGQYVVTLTVSDGNAKNSAQVAVNTSGPVPVANAGPNQTVNAGSIVTLDGSRSYDLDGAGLTYVWQIVSAPSTSNASLGGTTNSITPAFTADQPGTYVLGLRVSDGTETSALSTVTISTVNVPPVANAGPDQIAGVGSLVTLDGSRSTDVDGNLLTYRWTLVSQPSGSAGSLSSANAVQPAFTPDVAGTYVAQLVVNDGTVDSTPATVTITTDATLPPTANAGPDQLVPSGTVATLTGAGTDPQNLPLSYSWTLIARPAGSQATLSNATSKNASFVPDVLGSYVVQLVTNDGALSSVPSTVLISTLYAPPVANAGPNQTVAAGTMVTLDGSKSSDPEHNALTYSWSLLSVPVGSNAVLAGANTDNPQFLADLTGTYVAQLMIFDGTSWSTPQTVTITAAVKHISLTPNPVSVLLDQTTSVQITLTQPAGPGGLTVNLAGFDPTVIGVPSSVQVSANATTATFTVSPVAVGATQILATATGFVPGSVQVSVSAPSISLGLPLGVGVGHSAAASVTLSSAAPSAGVSVSLSSSNQSVASVSSASVLIPGGSTIGSFQVSGIATGSATISASAKGLTGASGSVLVTQLGAIGLPSNVSVAPGQTVTFPVTLSAPAPVGGEAITLSSSDATKVTVTLSVLIPEGKTSPTTQPQITGVAFGSATITATGAGYVTATQTVTVSSSLAFNPTSIMVGGGTTRTVTVGLPVATPSALTVNLSSNNSSVATIPASVVIPANGTSASVVVTTKATGTATITASTTTANIGTGTLAVTVSNFGGVTIPTSLSVGLGQVVVFPITLSTAAPAGGVTVNLSSNETANVTVSPSSVFIAQGQTQPTTQPQLTGVGPGAATITVSAPGYGSATSSVQTTASLSLTPQNVTITGAGTQSLSVTLSGAAPTGGLLINLTPTKSGVFGAPSSVTIPAGLTSVLFNVTGIAAGSTTLTASSAAPGVTSATDNITVTSIGAIGLPASISVAPAQSQTLAVTLPSGAPSGGVTVSLVSSDPTKATVSPSTVFIASGQTQPATQPQVTGVSFGTTTITASASGYSNGSSSVSVAAQLALSPSPLTITGPGTQNLTLTLSASAPTALTVTLSTNPSGVITVPTSVVIAKGATTATVPVTAVSAGGSVVTANANVTGVTNATATVSVSGAGALKLPSGVTVGLGQSTAFVVTLPSAAPAGGVTVSFSSSAPAVLGISPSSVVIPAGATTASVAPQVSGIAPGSATITASAPLYTSATQTVEVTASATLTPQNPAVTVGQTQNLTLTLSGAAPKGGLNFTVTSGNSSVATVTSSTVTVAQGSTTATITVNGIAAGTSLITASAANVSAATDTITVSSAPGITVPASITIGPGTTTPFNVSLAVAPTSNITVTLAISNPAIASLNFTNVSFNAGHTQPTSEPTLTGLISGRTSITASATGYATAASTVIVSLTDSLTPNSLTIYGPTSNGTLTLSLSSAPTSNVTFTLSSSNPSVAYPPGQILFTAGTQVQQFLVYGQALGTAVITASAPGFTNATSTVTVAPPAALSLSVSSNSISLGQSTTVTVGIPTAAPIGGVTVNLSSSSSNATLTSTAVTIPQGVTSATTTLTGANLGSAVISGNATGYTAPATFTVQVGASVNWTSPSVTILGVGKQGTLTLALSVAVPPTSSAVTINLSSSNPNVATVPATATFAAGAGAHPTVSVPVTSVGTGTATIHASGLNIPDADATATVGVPLTITSTSLPSGTVGYVYSTTVTTNGGVTPLTFSALGLPTSLSINSSTGQITGTPTAAFSGNVSVTVNDSSSPVQSQTATLNLVIQTASPASISASSGTPQSVTAGSSFVPLVAVVKDGHGNPVSGVLVTFTAPSSGASGTFAGGANTAMTNVSGLATSAVFTANGTAGSYNVTASVAGVNTSAVFALTNKVGPAASITASGGTPQSATVSTAFASALAATVKDAFGNPISGATVIFTAPASGASGTFSGSTNSTTAVTNGFGVATAPTFTANGTAGSYSVVAGVFGVSGTANFALTNLVGSAHSIAVSSGSPQTTVDTTAFPAPLAAIVKDTAGNPLSGVTVTFTAPSSGASGKFSNGTPVTTAQTNVSGIASVTFTGNSTLGSYSVTAQVASVSTPATFSLTNKLGLAASIAANGGTPQTTRPNTAFASSLSAIVEDLGGNPVTGASVTFTAPGSGATGTFAGGSATYTTTTGASGVATSTTFSANSTLGGFSVTATVSGLSGTSATFSLTNAVGAPASVITTSGNTQTAKIGTAFTNPLTATVKDASGDVLSGVTVTFTVNPVSGAGATFSNNSGTIAVVTNPQGVASSGTITANNTIGTYTVAAAVSGVSTPASFSLTNIAGTPGSIAATSGTPQSATISTAFSAPLVALVKDSSGNPVSGVAVIFTAPSSGASGTFAGGGSTATLNTNTFGVATSPVFTANSIAGGYLVSAATAGVSTQAQYSLTNVHGNVSSLTVSSGSGQSAAINAAFTSPLVVIAKDAGGNPVTGLTITFTAPASGASGTFAGGVNTAVTDSTGTATSAVFTANSKTGAYTVVASTAALTANFSLTNVAGAPSSVAVAGGSNQAATVNTAFTNPLKVLVKDSAGNPVSGVTVTFSAPASGQSGTFAGNVTTAVTDLTGTATSAVFTANAKAGAYSVTASVGGLSTSFALTNNAGPAATITVVSGSNQSTVIGTAFSAPLVALVVDASGNPLNGVAVTFTAPTKPSAGATFTGGVSTIKANTDATGQVSVPVTANTVGGSYAVTAAVNVSVNTTFGLTNRAGAAATISIVSGSNQSTTDSTAFASPLQVEVTDSGGNPVNGVTVLFTAPAVGPSGTFASSANTAVTNASGIASSAVLTANATPGAYSISATVQGNTTVKAVNFVLTNVQPPCDGCGAITVTGATIGKNLEASINITLNPPAPNGGVTVTVSSSDPTTALVGSSTIAGKGTITPAIVAGTAAFSTTVQALTNTGTAIITVSAPGYSDAQATITFANSGFVISGTNGVGGDMTVFQNTTTPLSVTSVLLDSNGQVVQNQSVRGGLSVSVPVSSSNTAIATVTPSSASFSSGAGTASVNLVASASNTGTTSVSVGTPSGYAAPATGSSLNATVQAVGVDAFTTTVGQGLEQVQTVSLSGPAPAAETLTITSNNPSTLLFSTSPTDPASVAPSIKVTVAAGHQFSGQFYVLSLASSGSATYTISGSSFSDVNGTVTFAPAGLAIESPGGFGATSFTAQANAPAATLTVYTGYVDSGNNFVAQQNVGMNAVTVNLASSNPSVASINPTVTIAAAAGSASTTLTNSTSATGSTLVTASATAFQPAAVQATYTAPDTNMIVSGDSVIGTNLESPYQVSIPLAAGSSGQQVTITSNSPSIFLSATVKGTGASSLPLTIPSGKTAASFYVQVFSNSGTGTISITSPGLTTNTPTITFAETAIVIPPFANGSPNSTGTLPAFVAYLDSSGMNPTVGDEVIAGPNAISFTLGSSTPSIVSVPATNTVPVGSNTLNVPLTFGSSGTATITVTQPAGFSDGGESTTNVSVQ